MSGVDPSVSSTSTLPPTTPEPSAPPPALPSGVHGHEHEHGVAELVSGVGSHLYTEAGVAMLEGAGGAVGLAAGATLSAVGWGVALYEMGHDLGTVLVDGDRDALLEWALGGTGTPLDRAYGAGIGAVMLGMNEAELLTAARGFPAGELRDRFVAGVQHAARVGSEGTPGWEDATREYRDLHRAWTDGQAAAIGGWDTPGRSEVFTHARAEMAAYLDAHPSEAAALRTEYQAHVRAGFIAADGGRIDTHRYELDAGYRCGVEHRRSLEGAELERERHDIVGMSASSFTLGTFAA